MKVMLVNDENVLTDVMPNGISKLLESEKIVLHTIHKDNDGLLCIVYGRPKSKEGETKEIRYGQNSVLKIKPPFLLARYDYGKFTDITNGDIAYYLLALKETKE